MMTHTGCLLAILVILCQSKVVTARWQQQPPSLAEISRHTRSLVRDAAGTPDDESQDPSGLKRTPDLPELPFIGGTNDVIARENQLDKNPIGLSSSMASRASRRRRTAGDSQSRWRSKLDDFIDKVRKRQWYVDNGFETRFPLPERRKFPEVDWRGFNEDVFHESFGDFTPMKRTWQPSRSSSKR